LRTAFPIWRRPVAKPQEWQFYSDYFASGYLEQPVQEMEKGGRQFLAQLVPEMAKNVAIGRNPEFLAQTVRELVILVLL
jgi:hypothetical protein